MRNVARDHCVLEVEQKWPSILPAVTVIVTVYKRTNFLEEALNSVLCQTFRHLDIIFTDDSNSDAVMAICDLFDNSQVRYRANSVTLGVVLNLRIAISEARGEYIAILNDDDVWEPDFLENLAIPLQEDSNISLAFCDHWIVSEDGSLDSLRI